MKTQYINSVIFCAPLILVMNVRFDTWMKRANLCAREPLSLLAEISSYSGPYGPHLLPRRIDGKTTRANAVCTKERCIEHLPLCCGESVSITHASNSILGPFSSLSQVHSETLVSCNIHFPSLIDFCGQALVLSCYAIK